MEIDGGHWTEIGIRDLPGLARVTEIMAQVDGAYARREIAHWQHWLTRYNGHLLLFQAPSWELVIAIEFNDRYQLFRVRTIGFTGKADLKDVVDIGTRRIVRFMGDHDLLQMYALRRKDLDNPEVNTLLDLVANDSHLTVTADHDFWDVAVWRLTIRERTD